jgi:hypothetical protein
MKATLAVTVAVLMLFVAPALAAIGWWASGDHPGSWRNADWSSSGVLPQAAGEPQAMIHIMGARTGGMKGALAIHSWIVTKAEGAADYDRYDKVGWGAPVRRNAYPADGRWYSNDPVIIGTLHGEDAARLIPKVEAAIAAYPHAMRGGYSIWPGPNSNSFVAHVLRAVPQLGMSLPPEAVGRDYPSEGRWAWRSPDGVWRLSLGGYAGFAAGRAIGIEVNLAGLVFGLDPAGPALKLPGFGRVGW